MTVEECCGASLISITNNYMRNSQCVPCSVGKHAAHSYWPDCYCSSSVLGSGGNKFWIGFMENARGPGLIIDEENSLLITLSIGGAPESFSLQNTSVTITEPGAEIPQIVTVFNNSTVTVSLDVTLRLQSNLERNKGILIEAETGIISVVGTNIRGDSSDSFTAIPCTPLPTSVYEFYAVSSRITELGTSSFLVVACESDTEVTVTPTQTIDDPNNPQQSIEAGESTVVFLDEGQTLYVRSFSDLTGSRIVTNKPVSFYSGHESGSISQRPDIESHFVEQLPPTAVWGTYLVALSPTDEFSDSVYRVLTAAPTSTIEVSCQTSPSFTTDIVQGEFAEFTAMNGDVCTVFSTNNDPLQLVQFTAPGGMLNILEVPYESQRIVLPPGDANYVTLYSFDDDLELVGQEWTAVPCSNRTQLPCLYYVLVQPNDEITIENLPIRPMDGIIIIGANLLVSVHTREGRNAGTAYSTGFEFHRNHGTWPM